MAYTKTNWQNLPNQTTPINATNLNNIENGIKTNDDKLLGNKPMGSIVVDNVSCKNMFNENYYASGILISDTGAETSTSAWNTSYYIEVNSSTTYTISYTGTVSAPIRVSYYNSSKTFISRITPDANPYSFTTPSNAKYVRISFASSGISNIQLEAGTTTTTYTKYKNFGLTIEAKQISGTTSNYGNLGTGINKKEYIPLCANLDYNNGIATFYAYPTNENWTLHCSQTTGEALRNEQLTAIIYYVKL